MIASYDARYFEGRSLPMHCNDVCCLKLAEVVPLHPYHIHIAPCVRIHLSVSTNGRTALIVIARRGFYIRKTTV